MNTTLPKMKDTSWNTPDIHGKDREGKETPGAHTFESTFTVLLDDQRVELSPEKFLHDAWTQGFNTPCNTCKENFNLATEPPVRLLGLGMHATLCDKICHLFMFEITTSDA